MQVRRAALLHRLHPRPDRAAADRSAAAGAAVRAGAHLAADGDGRDGVGAGARAQPAAVGHRQLPERLAAAARTARSATRRRCCATPWTRPAEQALRAGQIIRRLRDFVARGESERRVESISKLVEEASALALVGAKDTRRARALRFRAAGRLRAGRQGADSAGPAQSDAQRHRRHGRQRNARSCRRRLRRPRTT